MAEELEIKVSGTKNVTDAFKAFLGAMQGADLEKIFQPGAEIIRIDARRLAPEQASDMANSIKQETQALTKNEIEIAIGPENKYFYSLYAEMGTKGHKLKPKPGRRRKAKALEVVYQSIFTEDADHPGAEARPFMRPAFDNNVDQILDQITKDIDKVIEKW